jgi:E3 ubiquitin-protein ligase TRIP12
MLLDTIKFDHGYTRDSAAVSYLVRCLAALDSADQRRFLRFVTGSPRLPPGGIAALKVCPIP